MTILIALFLAGLIGLAEAWARLRRPRAECPRKLVHLVAGLVCACFPLLVDSAWVVAGLAVPFTLLLVLATRRGFLRSLGAVDRKSLGVELFPAAICATFVLAGDRAWLYVAAVLALAVADTAAALAGTLLGRREYFVWGERRTLEGSAAFLVACFVCLAVPLTAAGAGTVWAALIASVLCTGVEALSPRGTDNVLVPLAVVVSLPALVALSPTTLAVVGFGLAEAAAIGFLLLSHSWRFSHGAVRR